jgi:hypothetical protein
LLVRIQQGAFRSEPAYLAKKLCCNRLSGCQALPDPARPCQAVRRTFSQASGPGMGCLAPWRRPAGPRRIAGARSTKQAPERQRS